MLGSKGFVLAVIADHALFDGFRGDCRVARVLPSVRIQPTVEVSIIQKPFSPLPSVLGRGEIKVSIFYVIFPGSQRPMRQRFRLTTLRHTAAHHSSGR